MKKIFVTGIGTDIGKTFISAILTEAFQADYWKPVQAGAPSDSDTVRGLISNTNSVIHPETYRLREPRSPHDAAAAEGIHIDPDKITLPQTTNTLIIEGAGGLMVPLNEKYFVADLIKKFGADTVLVVQNYLGSINHTLLSIDLLNHRGIKVSGLVFNGPSNPASERVILSYSRLPVIAYVADEPEINNAAVRKYASVIRPF